MKKLILLVLAVCMCASSLSACSATKLKETANSSPKALKVNQLYSGFRLVAKKYIKELNGTSFEFLHERTKAKLLFLENNDDKKVFSTIFKVKPHDNTGVFHIIEHAIGRNCKSKNRGRAYTDENISQYCVLNRNNGDFDNDIEALLNAIYKPELLTNKNIFLTEGWRYELASAKGELKLNGIVYNEMNGKDSTYKKLTRVIADSLFPDTSSRFDPGGVPDEIPKVSYKQFLSAYKKYYVPSNSCMFLSGKLDIEKELELINKKYLSKLKSIAFRDNSEMQQGFSDMKYVEDFYPLDKGSSTKDKTILAINYVLGDAKDAESAIAYDILDDILDADNSPLKKALQDNNMPVYTLSGGVPQHALSFVLEGANAYDKEKFKLLLDKALKNIVAKGIDKKFMSSILSSFEMQLRNTFISKNKYAHIIAKTADAWICNQGLNNALSSVFCIKDLKEKSKNRYFENLIQKCIINNTHASYVVLTPKPGLKEELAAASPKKLAEYKAGLTQQQLNALIKENRVFSDYQKKQELEQKKSNQAAEYDLSKYKAAETIQTEVNKVDGVKVLKHFLPTCGISYVNFYFDTRKVEQNRLMYLILLTKLLGKVSTSNCDSSELCNNISTYTGGMDFSICSYESSKKQEDYYPKMQVSISALNANLEKGLTILKQIANDSRFNGKKELRKLISKVKWCAQADIQNAKFSYAACQALSNVSQNEKYNSLEYVPFYEFISKLDNNFEQKYSEIAANLTNVYKTAFDKENLIVSYTGDKKNYPQFEKVLAQVTTGLKKNNCPIHKYNFSTASKKQGYTLQLDVQDIIKAGNYKQLGYCSSGKLAVLRSALDEYLYNNVRMRGGAYDTGAWIDDSYIVLYSSEDPDLMQTINIFNQAGTVIKNLKSDAKKMEYYKYSAIKYIDSDLALEPKDKGIKWDRFYITGRTQEDIQKYRNEIFTTKAEDLCNYAKLIDQIIKQNNLCVVGNKQKLEEEASLFDNISDVLSK